MLFLVLSSTEMPTLKRLAKTKSFWILLGLVILLCLFYSEAKKDRREVAKLTSGEVELCITCHQEVVPEKVHDKKVVGCSSCHLGNPYTLDLKEAHKNIVKNPGDLRYVNLTCGQPGCHPTEISKVKNSLMATNHGMIKRVVEVFEEKEVLSLYPKLSVSQLYQSEVYHKTRNSLGLDYYRKLCGSCHLWLEKGKLPYFLKEKGGGCTACHLVKEEDEGLNSSRKTHPKLVRYPPMENCVRCHNRSGRIGFTYQGLYENEQGGVGDEVWVDGRWLDRVSPDIHFQKGLNCVDCHTKEEVMGDGNFYYSLHEALEIECQTCHGGDGTTKKGRKLKNFQKKGTKAYLEIKGSKKLLLIKKPVRVCSLSYHKRLTCVSCHAKHMPDCYGCHIKYDPRETHLDKILAKETKGLWIEHESYRRLALPTLAVEDNQRVVTVTPG
ncbi:hypothetical protein [Thermodesulfobacterium thermophilum]|uniref:hypothetical protein n=1 Tax=Thermodesulfobacterium thermophilum TaxID=886 RepID=UPI0003B3C5E4|nr:hypothetical protein [Thermodesulfobacterium thermophilum]